jgi:hypothetical protein
MGTDTLIYRLYYGHSEDGRGTPKKIGSTPSKTEAQEHLRCIKKDPYSFGHVMVDLPDGTERRVSWGVL